MPLSVGSQMGIPFNTLYHQNTIDGLKAVGITDDMGDEAYAEARLTVADKVKKMQGKAAKAEAKLGEGEGETVQVVRYSLFSHPPVFFPLTSALPHVLTSLFSTSALLPGCHLHEETQISCHRCQRQEEAGEAVLQLNWQ